MDYIAWDMARASKSQDQDVIGTLQEIAERVMLCTGFSLFLPGSIQPVDDREVSFAQTALQVAILTVAGLPRPN